MYKAIEVANYIIEYEHSRNRQISNIKLQKLLYFIQAQFFRMLGEPCFSDEIEAWSVGPVVENVYHSYKFYGGMDITELKENINNEHITNKDKKVINEVLEFFSNTPVYELVDIAYHQTPWIYANRNPFDKEIKNAYIKQFFCRP